MRNGLKVVAAIAALGVAGCGGDSNKALSYSDFSKKANDICLSSGAELKAIGSKISGKASADAPLLDQVVPKLEAGRQAFGKLKPPDALKANFDNFLSLTDEQIATTKEAQVLAKKGDDAAYIATLKKLPPIGQKSNLEGSKLGAADCAK
jgi:hypothetical protein